jgi:hypothetical protein
MHPKRFVAVFLILAAASCSRSGKMQRDQQQYDVVQEGSANGGVTSTINGPGETTPPLTTSTVTGTNVDTTTAFTVPGTTTATTSTAPPGTIAGSLPDSSTGFPSGYTPARPRPRPRPATLPPTTTATDTATPPPPTDTTGTQG